MTNADVLPTSHDRAVAPARQQRGVGIAMVYAVTSFLGSALLFMVQPLAAKLVLPSFGGSATVWSTSSLFFQVLLLVGYLYAHVSTRRLGAHWQPRTHLLVLALPLLALPVVLPDHAAPDADVSPALWLLRVLAVMVGLPFLVLSATGPLVQRWYSWSRGPRADDPYFLFASSNLGSFVGLLSYPFVIEPTLTLPQQRLGWSWALVAFLVLMGVCATLVRAPREAEEITPVLVAGAHRLPPSRLALWGALSFLPSCLMLAVTAHISTDVAPIPLVWVLPLAVYLASFVVAFAKSSRNPPVIITRLAVASALVSGVASLVTISLPIFLVVTLDVAVVALVGYAAHARLATTRPEPRHLTTFYLVISVGGALGGLVNGVVAPLLFNRVWEYGFTLAAVPLLMLGVSPRPSSWFTRRYHPLFRALVGVVGIVVVMVMSAMAIAVVTGTAVVWAVLGLAAVGAVGWSAARTPLVLAAGLAVLTTAVGVQAVAASMLTERTFYGSYRVLDADGMHKLVHGTTVHGIQFQDAARRTAPTSYYSQDGPLGEVMPEVDSSRTGIVGLGAGGIAAYARPGDHFTFYEIDPVIARIAEDPRYFSFLTDSAAQIDVQLGDGRLRLQDEQPGQFDLLILDAFSSDSIPVHLLTREAFGMYLSRLRPDGTLVVHVSNRIFDLKPVVAAVAGDLGLSVMSERGGLTDQPDSTESEWLVLTSDISLQSHLGGDGWTRVEGAAARVWTDDYASILSALR